MAEERQNPSPEDVPTNPFGSNTLRFDGKTLVPTDSETVVQTNGKHPQSMLPRPRAIKLIDLEGELQTS